MRLLIGLAVLAASCTTPADDLGPPDPAPAPLALTDLVAHAGWIFEGTVTALHATTQGTPDLTRAVVVRVERVSVEPLESPLPPGSSDTVELLAPPGPELVVGTRAYFFVTWREAGTSWLFTELGRVDGAALTFDDLHARVHTIKRALLDRALYDRMIGSERVIRGTVTGVADLPGDPETLDGPDWWVATVQPRNTLRGPVEVAPIEVRYNGAADAHCCLDFARPEVGIESLFLIQDDTVTGHGPGRLVIDPLDVQPARALERLRSLLASPPR